MKNKQTKKTLDLGVTALILFLIVGLLHVLTHYRHNHYTYFW